MVVYVGPSGVLYPNTMTVPHAPLARSHAQPCIMNPKTLKPKVRVPQYPQIRLFLNPKPKPAENAETHNPLGVGAQAGGKEPDQ